MHRNLKSNSRPELGKTLVFPDGDVLHIGAVATMFDVTERSIEAMIARRQIPFRKLGKRVIFLRAELELFFQSLPGTGVEEALEARRR